MIAPNMEKMIERRAKGNPIRKPKGLQQQSSMVVFSLLSLTYDIYQAVYREKWFVLILGRGCNYLVQYGF